MTGLDESESAHASVRDEGIVEVPARVALQQRPIPALGRGAQGRLCARSRTARWCSAARGQRGRRRCRYAGRRRGGRRAGRGSGRRGPGRWVGAAGSGFRRGRRAGGCRRDPVRRGATSCAEAGDQTRRKTGPAPALRHTKPPVIAHGRALSQSVRSTRHCHSFGRIGAVDCVSRSVQRLLDCGGRRHAACRAS